MMMKSLRKLLIAAALLSVTLTAYGNHALAVIYVPADYPTIQEAIDAAVIAGDMDVVVSDGTYVENISFPGAMLYVSSVNGPEATIIDGSSQPGVPVVSMTVPSIDQGLTGFTIKNGSAPQGGGIYISSNYPSISNCIITNNTATIAGGGIYLSATGMFIEDVVISGNHSDNDGGGIYTANGDLYIEGGTISNNTAGNSGGGVAINPSGGYGGYFDKCIISNNTATAGSGGGVAILGMSNYGSFYNCIISNNNATAGSGGGIVSSGMMLDIFNCTITGNTAGISGGGIANTNYSLLDGTNNILWGDTPDEIFADDPFYVFLTYSDIQNDWIGDPSNKDCDPQFVGPGDFHLTSSSCCIDAGTNVTSVTDDIEGNPRPLGAGFDMGAYEFVGSCTDGDNDTYAIEGGDCGPVDCDDNDPAVNPGASEVCDGKDNDCNGPVDDNPIDAGAPCSEGIGECQADGILQCVSGALECDAVPGIPGTEVCDGLDNDCDGVSDGSEGLTQQCGSTDVGECSYGTETCDDSGAWVGCDAVGPAPEVCTGGLDEDCDGMADCDDGDCASSCGPQPEVCDDGIDNDFDGKTDCDDKKDCNNDPACSGGGSTEDCTNGTDDDGDGKVDCDDRDCRNDPACEDPPPADEICDDGIDNDGDGKTDCADKKDCNQDPACQ